MLVACSKHPSSVAGVWQRGQSGLFSAQVTLKLGKDGSAAIRAGSAWGGGSANGIWEVSGDSLKIDLPDGGSNSFKIISKSKTNLVLEDKSGAVETYTRIGDG